MSHKEQALAIQDRATSMDVTTFFFRQNPGKEDLIRGKKGKGVKIAPPEEPLPSVVYATSCVTIVKDG
jgi:hypothetical protein